VTLVTIISTCLNETYSKPLLWVNIDVMFSILNSLKQGDALATVLLQLFFLHFGVRKSTIGGAEFKWGTSASVLLFVC